jgi:hypothetical protein
MIKILTEPCGKTYELLIDLAGRQCPNFSLVWPYDMKLDDSTDQIHQELIEFLESEQEIKNKWTAKDIENEVLPIVRKFRVTLRSLGVLKTAPELFACPDRENKVFWRKNKNRSPGLYSWISPALPEDLTFYSSDGDIWLSSISHEEEAYFESSNIVFKDITEKIPDLSIEAVE